MKRIAIFVLLFWVTASLATDKRDQKRIASEFCGKKYSATIYGKNGDFFLKCKQDDGSFSAVFDNGVLYTIYAKRTVSNQKVELINPSDERWVNYVALRRKLTASQLAVDATGIRNSR